VDEWNQKNPGEAHNLNAVGHVHVIYVIPTYNMETLCTTDFSSHCQAKITRVEKEIHKHLIK
jgi:hypothetical protein